MDIEWLLSTLFDASLLSPSSRRLRRLFFVPFWDMTSVKVAIPLSLPGNYVAKVAHRPAGQKRSTGRCLPSHGAR